MSCSAMVFGVPAWRAMWTVRATSSTITAALTAACASLPIVNGPWLAISTAGERLPLRVSTMPRPIESSPISANGPTGTSPPNSSAIMVSTQGMGCARAAHPLRADHDGRRVRRRRTGRSVRADRRRLDRARHRGHPQGEPLPRSADGQPRPVHDRQRRPGCGQGRGDGRGRRTHGPHRLPGRNAENHCTARHRQPLRPIPERLRTDRRNHLMTVETAPQPTAVWFLTGSQGLYGRDVISQVEQHSRDIATQLDAADAVASRVIWKPVLTDADAIRRLVLEANADDACVGIIAWMHTFSPAKMWISGLDALRKPLLHLHTQANVDLPWGEIDMDFMNLNQAAHGDREFGYIQTRIGMVRK